MKSCLLYTSNVNSVEMDLNVIKSDLKEAVKTKGAFWCDYTIFKNIYRIHARSIQDVYKRQKRKGAFRGGW